MIKHINIEQDVFFKYNGSIGVNPRLRKKKSSIRKADYRDNVKVVTDNRFITAYGLQGISLKARKLLYIAIAQCKITDKEFYEFSITPLEFADLMGISPTHIYEEADKITDELMKGFIKVVPENEKKFKKYSLFSTCEYTQDYEIKFKLNPDMTDFFLELKKNFSQPLLLDFMKMRSPYSIAIWHLIQREMESKKPKTTEEFKFYVSLDELRQVTGTEDKLKQLVNFKERVLDKALLEIKETCWVDITYSNVKQGRTVIGFNFIARNIFHFDIESLDPEFIKRVQERAEAINNV